MFKFHDERGTCIQTSEQQKGYLEKAGFVDIQVFKKVIDMGCYSHGLLQPVTKLKWW
jgi:hypothetical protein